MFCFAQRSPGCKRHREEASTNFGYVSYKRQECAPVTRVRVMTGYQVDATNNRCFTCGTYGHWAHDCIVSMSQGLHNVPINQQLFNAGCCSNCGMPVKAAGLNEHDIQELQVCRCFLCFEVVSFQFTTECGESASFGKNWKTLQTIEASFRGVLTLCCDNFCNLHHARVFL